MKFLLRLLCLPLLACSLNSCNSLMSIPTRIIGTALNTVKLANHKQKEKALQEVAKTDGKTDPKANEPDLMGEGKVGEVSYVDAESGFILIRQASGRRIIPSTPLLSQNLTGTITAKLISSPANKGSFVAADILSGSPERGNPVLVDADAKAKLKAGAKPTISPAAPDPSAAEAATPRTSPKLEPILPPLQDLRPPSGEVQAPDLPSLPQ